MFKKRIGLDPHRDGMMTAAVVGCPDIWELENGDFAIIGSASTQQLKPHLPADARCGPDEAIVVIPRALLLNAKSHIPDV